MNKAKYGIFKLETKFQFGKYKGHPLKDVIENNPQYIDWCLDKELIKLPLFTKMYFNYKYKIRLKKEEPFRELQRRCYNWMENNGIEYLDDGNGNSGFFSRNGDEMRI